MGQIISNNCIGNVNDIYEPTTYIDKNSKKTIHQFSRRPSFVRFVETINKELKICEMCKDGTIIQYNQCIECGNYHCGTHRNEYHNLFSR